MHEIILPLQISDTSFISLYLGVVKFYILVLLPYKVVGQTAGTGTSYVSRIANKNHI